MAKDLKARITSSESESNQMEDQPLLKDISLLIIAPCNSASKELVTLKLKTKHRKVAVLTHFSFYS